ncbi:hypothetical protein [Mycolicibacter sinensis]|uniref:Antitoxin Xre/MbcA/ParS-like toxin-binding domain-containing protein n=1 Tax=Mycolicibacter sinensis (strain JDM601) TaxID=875328 RepID=A0A1A2ERR2_MYCSD|nr:hypothetical protein [Mycolicibacter sinensis]OBG05820.1 hypothetical protein A5771_09520 [Mycolicibacter sinensis]OBG06840.1 hypothetical protein A5772_20920 [Mycolicibacter sinensis]
MRGVSRCDVEEALDLIGHVRVLQADHASTTRTDLLRALMARNVGDTTTSNTRTWLTRRRESHEVFTLTHQGRTVIPAFQLDELGRPRPELQPILAALAEAGITGWPLWTWLTSPTALLSGEIPEQLALHQPRRGRALAGLIWHSRQAELAGTGPD